MKKKIIFDMPERLLDPQARPLQQCFPSQLLD